LDPDIFIPPQNEFDCAVLLADFPASVLRSTP
jgi:hypothetical protein